MAINQSEFERYTRTTAHDDGSCIIECSLGLWAVTARNKSQAIIEAKHYFIQYWNDGEYISDPMEKLAFIAQKFDMGY